MVFGSAIIILMPVRDQWDGKRACSSIFLIPLVALAELVGIYLDRLLAIVGERHWCRIMKANSLLTTSLLM